MLLQLWYLIGYSVTEFHIDVSTFPQSFDTFLLRPVSVCTSNSYVTFSHILIPMHVLYKIYFINIIISRHFISNDYAHCIFISSTDGASTVNIGGVAGACVGSLVIIGFMTAYYNKRSKQKGGQINTKSIIPGLEFQRPALFIIPPERNSRSIQGSQSQSQSHSHYSFEMGSDCSTPFKNLSDAWSPEPRVNPGRGVSIVEPHSEESKWL